MGHSHVTTGPGTRCRYRRMGLVETCFDDPYPFLLGLRLGLSVEYAVFK